MTWVYEPRRHNFGPYLRLMWPKDARSIHYIRLETE